MSAMNPPRPPLDRTVNHGRSKTHNGHVYPIGRWWTYPCEGCGCEWNDPERAVVACPSPVSERPEALSVVLMEIRDLLRVIEERTR